MISSYHPRDGRVINRVMPIHLTQAPQSAAGAIESAIKDAIQDAEVDVVDRGGKHYAITVRSPSFEGKRTLQRHRQVMAAIKHLMDGEGGPENAPVHAIDSLQTQVP